MPKGKMVAQGAHASLGAVMSLMKETNVEDGVRLTLDVQTGSAISDWTSGIYTKIALAVNSEEEILDLNEKAKNLGLPHFLVRDVGLTCFHGIETITALAIGPALSEYIDSLTKDLKLLN